MRVFIVSFLLLFGLTSSSLSQSNAKLKPFTIKGKILNEKAGKLIIRYLSSSNYIQDTVTIENGKFVCSGFITEPTSADIVGSVKEQTPSDPNFTYIYIEPRIMTVLLEKDKFKDVKVTGSKTQKEFNELNATEVKIDKKIENLRFQHSLISDSLKMVKDEASRKRLNKNIDETDDLILELREQYYFNEIKFVQSHPKSFVTGDILLLVERNEKLSLDSIKSLFTHLDPIIQKSRVGIELQNDIIKKGKTAVGEIAPDFTAIDLNNETVKLSDFIGKNEIILVFWASWCIPCRQSFPHLKELYNKYHSKGLEIIGVSIDYKKDAWISAVNKDSVGMWHQVHSSDKFRQGPPIIDEIMDKYRIQGIPVKFLIDRNGKILGKWSFDIEAMDKKLEKIYNP